MSGADINDLMFQAGAGGVQAAFDGARRVVMATATPTKRVRDAAGVELLKTVVATGSGYSTRILGRWLIYARRDIAAAARMVPALALAQGITASDPSFDSEWAEKLATRYEACGTGWQMLADHKGDRRAQRRPCHAPGCACGTRRAMRRIHGAYKRLAAIPGAERYQLFHAVRSLGNGTRTRGFAPRHAQLLVDARTAFSELRAAPSVLGGHAWQRTEALYGPWEGCVSAIGVALDLDAVGAALARWQVRRLGDVASDTRRVLAGWFAAFGAWRIAPEMGIEDRAHCLLDEYLFPKRGSLVFGIVHGNALVQLERRVPPVAVDMLSSTVEDDLVPHQRCPCGAKLFHRGACDPEVLASEGWTPAKTFKIADALGDVSNSRWISRDEAIEAAAARDASKAVVHVALANSNHPEEEG